MYDDLYALAHEIDSNLQRIQEATTSATARQYRQPIDAGMGTVTVSGSGSLLAIDLDPRYLRRTTGRALGTQILNAIRQAEGAAQAAREQEIADANHPIL